MQSIITLDGPSGVGKSTIARLFAKRINYRYLDTGCIYRALTYYIIKEKILLKNKEKIQEALRQVKIDIRDEDVYLNDANITDKIRTKEINENVPLYAQNEDIRAFTRRIQARLGERGNTIVDGRDIGTVVFPKAFCKFYLDASHKTRSERRHKDLKTTEPNTSLEEVEQALQKRDHQDTTRKKSPLKIPLDALVIDTTSKTVDDVLEIMSEHYNKQISQEMQKNSSSDYEEFLTAMDRMTKHSTLQQQDIQKGKVIHIGKEIILNIGEKKDAIISEEETSRLDLSSLRVGEEVSVLVKATPPNEERIRVSMLAIQMREGLDYIQGAYDNQQVIKGLVLSEVKGGMLVNVKSIRCFCPYSELDIYKTNKQQFIGKEERFLVISFEKGKAVLSRKQVLEKIVQHSKKNYFASTQVGDIRDAKVVKMMNHGALVELEEGIVAMLRPKNVSWERSKAIEDLIQEGDRFKVCLLEINEDLSRIEVSKKHAEEDPMVAFSQTAHIGDVVEGTVKTIKPYGAFINVAPGVEGLLHISDMSWIKKLSSPRELLKEGDRVNVSILFLDPHQRKLSLGLKQVETDPWETIESRFPLDTIINVTVKAASTKGLYCMTDEQFEGFVHRDDFSWNQEKINLKKQFPIGSTMEVIVIGYDKTRKMLKFGLKQKTANPWKDLEANYGVNGVIRGKVSKIIDTGCFVDLNDGLEGFCHISQLGEQHYEKVEDAVKVGESYDFLLQKIEESKHQIHLSIKALLHKKHHDNVQKYIGKQEKTRVTIRDLIQ